MRGKTKAQALEALARAERESDIYMLALNAALAGRIEWVKSIHTEEGYFRFGFSDLTRASGGLFYQEFTQDGGKGPWVQAFYLDDAAQWYNGGRDLDLARACAIERAQIRRNEALAEVA